MSGMGGDLTFKGLTNSIQNKNYQAWYMAPKTEQKVIDETIDFNKLTWEQIKALKPKNWFDDKSDYWEDGERQFFYGKDGTSNAYVKQGMDTEIEEYVEREITERFSWRLQTDEPIIFKSGGKIRVRGRDWYIVQVINQDATGTIQNKLNAFDTNPNAEWLQRLGLKTLVLV